MTIWKSIPFAPKWEASDDGDIRSTSTGQILTYYTHFGQKAFYLWNQKHKTIYHVKDVVYETFHVVSVAQAEIKVINGNENDCRLANLVCTEPEKLKPLEERTQDPPKAVLSWAEITAIVCRGLSPDGDPFAPLHERREAYRSAWENLKKRWAFEDRYGWQLLPTVQYE